MICRALGVLLLVLRLSMSSYAQLPAITFEVISSKDGLPGNTVLSATRDHKGFMWFGTRQDVVRYNGATFRRFTSPETNIVTRVVADDDNNIWLSSDRNGVCRIDAHTQQMECMPQTPEQDIETVGFFYIDRHKNGWYSDRSGVTRMNLTTRERKHFPFRQTTFVWSKASFVEDIKGTLWIIGRDNGLFRYDRDRDAVQCVLGADCDSLSRSKEQLLLSATSIADDDGTLWIGSYNAGLLHYDPATNTYEKYFTGRRTNQINSIARGIDENGHEILWVGDNQGLGIFRPEQKKFFFFQNILPNPYEVNYIYHDTTDGIVWVCTSEGIIKYNPLSNVIRSFMLPGGMVANPVTINVILQDNQYQNIIYLGLSHTGIVQWNKVTHQFTLIRYPEGGETRWMTQRSDGTLWIGTNRWDFKRPGLLVYSTDQEKFITTTLSREANKFYSVPFFMYGGFDNQDRLWVGNSDEGLHVLDGKTGQEVFLWDSQEQTELLQNNNLINDMLLHGGHVWLATMRGVYLLNEDQRSFQKVDSDDVAKSLQDVATNSLLLASDGSLWSARWGSLTNTWKGKFNHVLTGQDGFVDRQIDGLIEDNQQNIWAGNYEGLYCFHHTTQKLKRFTVNDGLISNNTLGRLFRSRDGSELYVGNQNGFNLINVNRLLQNTQHAVLGVSSFKVHEKEKGVDFSRVIILSPEENAFSVDFIALNYRKLHDNEYAYYLQGFEQDWNYSGSNHLAYYTNLSPGTYTLHMRAGDVLGNWGADSTITIRILPAYYETWWFKLWIGVIICAVLYGLYRYRINQLLRLQHVRNRISADLHDELGSSLSGISIIGALAKKNLPPAHPSRAFMERMMDEIHQISGSLDDIVWNISPRNDGLSSLMARMTRHASELFEARQIQYHFSMPDHVDNIRLSMEQRRNFYLIFKETINNLIKYSRCANASIHIHVDKRRIRMIIEDDGVGFDPEMPSERNGLQNLKDRATHLKGELEIQSDEGKGTRVMLDFPIG